MKHPKGCYGCGRKRCGSLSGGSLLNTSPAIYGLRVECEIRLAVVEEELMAMSRSKSASDSPGMKWVDEAFFVEYPDLYEFMSETVWDDGKPRKTGTMVIAVEGRVIKASVHDRDGRRSAWVTAEEFATLLKRIDEGLRSDALDWRKDTR